MKLFFIGMATYMLVLYALLFRQGLGKNLLNPQLADCVHENWLKHVKNLDRSAGNAMEQAILFIP